MRRFTQSIGLLAGTLFLLTSTNSILLAQFSGAFEGMSFQGYLTDDSNNPINAPTDITVRLFDASGAGTEVWERVYTNVPVVDGVFQVMLQSGTPLMDRVSFAIPLWLEAEVEGEVIGPRTQLASSPYALSLRNMRIIPGTEVQSPSIVGGFVGNGIGNSVYGATISGGGSAVTSGSNTVNGDYGAIGGGRGNAAGSWATVAGGQFNNADASGAAIGGGADNLAESGYATIAGGLNNHADGLYATITGGKDNDALGSYSMVAGGLQNRAGAQYSFVAGDRARTRTPGEAGTGNGDEGTFVWSDRSVTGSDFTSTGPNQFLVQAAGGVGIDTNDPAGQLHIAKANSGAEGFIIEATESDRAHLYFAANTSLIFDTFRGSDSRRLPIAMQPNGGNVGIGTTTPSVRLEVNGNVLANNVAVPSDARYKNDVSALSGSLDRLSELRGVSYTFDRETFPEKDFAPGTHMGVIAQEVREVFPELVNESESGYLSVNYIGLIPVLLEAIKEQQALLAGRDARIDQLEARLDAVVGKLEAL